MELKIVNKQIVFVDVLKPVSIIIAFYWRKNQMI